jgi:MoaA/NifB/PqqE/SkfB family radical SAM enzyme
MNSDELRRLQEQGAVDLYSALRSVEINPTELCNRACPFCPRVDPNIYKNQKKHIDPDLCTLLGEQLSTFGFDGRIGFVGFGEPLLHPNITECVRNIKQSCPTAKWIEINTNGDLLTRDIAIDLANAGCTTITVSMYDRDDTVYFTEMLVGVKIELVLKHQYDIANIKIINRIDIIQQTKVLNISRHCYIPFYKIFVDWNGDYLLCQQDWGKTTNTYNIKNTPVIDYWLSKLTEYRKNLSMGNRIQNPCDKCDIDGTVYGKSSFDLFI